MAEISREFKNVDGFVYSSYSEIPWESQGDVSIKGTYESSRVPTWAIFSRFQRLDMDAKGLFQRLKFEGNLSRDVSSGFENLSNEAKHMANLGLSFSNRTEREQYLEKMNLIASSISDLEKATMPGLYDGVSDALEALQDFERDYISEMRFVYETGRADSNFARARLKKPGKYRVAEPLLIAKNRVLDAGELFNSIYINSSDRQLLAELVDDKTKGYLVPNYILSDRIEHISRILNDENILKMLNDPKTVDPSLIRVSPEKLRSSVSDLKAEQEVLGSILKNRQLNLN